MGCCFSSEKKYVEVSVNGSGGPPFSARQHRPPVKKNRDRSSEDDLQVPKIKSIPISEITKIFQDHELLYEDLIYNYNRVITHVHDFKKAYEEETTSPQLQECVHILASRCANTSLDIKRRKHSVLIGFSERDVHVLKNCRSEPTAVVQSLNLFNSLNKHLDKVLDRTLLLSINDIISDETNLSLQILKAFQGPEAIYIMKENVRVLGRMAGNINFMQKRCYETFKVVLESSKVFFDTT